VALLLPLYSKTRKYRQVLYLRSLILLILNSDLTDQASKRTRFLVFDIKIIAYLTLSLLIVKMLLLELNRFYEHFSLCDETVD